MSTPCPAPVPVSTPTDPNIILKGLADQVTSLTEIVTKMQNTPVYPMGVNPATGQPWAQPADPKEEARFGFKSFRHFLHDIEKAATEHSISPVLKAWTGSDAYKQNWANWVEKAPSGMNETVLSEGGALVPPGFSNELLRRTYENDLLSRCRNYPITGNSLSFPAIDETSRVDGSRFGGVRCYWEAEANAYTATKPAYNRVTLTLNKLIGLCHVTDELKEDMGMAAEQHVFDLFSQEIAFKIGDSIINGSGAGMPQGILNAPATVSVSKETGQAATTLVFENINKMWQRMWAPSRKNAVWLINQDIEHQLHGLAINVGTGGLPAYLPPGGLNDAPYGMLKGRPILPVEFCATLGTVGDIILADFSMYLTGRKGETQQETSIHFKFDTGEQSFRTTFRVDGKAWWTAALTPFRGTNTLSPFVSLATRA